MYSLRYDAERGFIRMVVQGFWDIPTVEACTAEMLPLLKAARAGGGRALVLSDARDFPVQSAEVGAAFGRMEAVTGHLRDRMAMVVGSTLSKMQGQRTVAGSTTEFFTDIAEAEAWLLSLPD